MPKQNFWNADLNRCLRCSKNGKCRDGAIILKAISSLQHELNTNKPDGHATKGNIIIDFRCEPLKGEG